jgi:hypothetical protein
MTGTENKQHARFRDLIDTHGAAPDCWPAEDRAWAEALSETDPEARVLLAEADTLDRQLNTVAAPSPSAALMGRILAAVPSGENGWRLPSWLFPLWRPVGAMAVALMLGLAVGVMTPPELTGNQTVAEEVDLLYGNDTVAGLDNGDAQ